MSQRTEIEIFDQVKPGLGLQNLPTELLRLIFGFCEAQTLSRLSRTCRRFSEVVSEDKLWKNAGINAIITNFAAESVQERSLRELSMKDRCRVSHNWRIGKYSESIFRLCPAYHRTRYMPWLVLQSGALWLAKGNLIKAFARRQHSLVTNQPIASLRGGDEDLSRFVVKDGHVISGGRDGGLYGWTEEGRGVTFQLRHSHDSDVHGVDFSQGVVISGARDGTVKIWGLMDLCKNVSPRPLRCVVIGDRVWCVAASPQGDMWCCGSSALHWVPPLHVYDLARGDLLARLGGEGEQRVGAGILDVAWEAPQQLLTCGYECTLRLWDLRTGCCEGYWEDPHDTLQYCLASDLQNSVLCGTGRHGRVQLWDKRHSKGVQMYFAKEHHSSPVYSLAFDPSSLYVALDQSLNTLDFSGRAAAVRNYAP